MRNDSRRITLTMSRGTLTLMLMLATVVAGIASACDKEPETPKIDPNKEQTFTCVIEPDSKLAVSRAARPPGSPGTRSWSTASTPVPERASL